MKTQNKRFISRVSQAGSLMIEAMAMLALISLVTPTLYKKSAERTTELQDINTATHVRTVMKAVDNYAAANYQELIHDLGEGQVKNIEIDDETYASFFPYGYKFDDLKNFDKPKVALRRQGNSITSFVQFPKRVDVGEMRAARIASMVGSNGGYVDGNGDAKGVGGVWSLAKADLGGLSFDSNKGSVVVASSEAINSANSAALENEKYLQRTKVESEDQKWRNAMTTDLYMGGVANVDNMSSILGVEQLIIGSADPSIQTEDLVISETSTGGGSAWLAGNLSAISNKFTVTADSGGGNPELLFGDDAGNYTISALTGDVSFNDGNVEFVKTVNDADIGAIFKVNTQVEKGLNVFGNTSVATEANAAFKAGVDGSYITADASSVNLQGGNVVVTKGVSGTPSLTNINTEHVNIKGDTKIGEGDIGPVQALSPKLNVQGNAFVRDILEAGEIDTKKFKTLELHAGGASYEDNKQWLHATADGVKVINPNLGTPEPEILEIDADTSALYGPSGKKGGVGPAVILGDTNAQMRGETYAAMYTTDSKGFLTLQNDALRLTGTLDDPDNRIDMSASITSVNEGVFQVQGTTAGDDTNTMNTSLYVNPNNGGEVEIGAHSTTVKPGGANGFFEVVKEDGRKILNVTPDRESTANPAVAEVDAKGFRVSYVNPAEAISSGLVLDIDARDYKPNTSDSTGNLEGSDASVYIRRGAIELESPSGIEYAADNGVGYIEAGRFVANTKYDGSAIDRPKYAEDIHNNSNAAGSTYDRYLVNPAYTSVMHDIKLTTRGGARLSDILPDFINKGIYVVNNTYKDNLDINNIVATAGNNGGQITVTGADELPIGTTLTGAHQWASPFLGVVPAPQCPAGYSRVITITPAGFMMSQAGQMVRVDHFQGDVDGSGKRFVIDPNNDRVNQLSDVVLGTVSSTITGAGYTTTSITDAGGTSHDIYYLGHATEPSATKNGTPFSPDPLYFQQSTWLKSKVIPQKSGHAGACSPGIGAENCGSEFVGWSAIMGFIYPGSHYGGIIKRVTGAAADSKAIYWNVFPVMAQTLEAYATAYCYFDRTNIYQSGNNPQYVDQYDQLNSFRKGHKKEGATFDSGGGASNNADYLERLNDPTLKYDNPW